MNDRPCGRKCNAGYRAILEIVMLRGLIIAIAVGSALGISLCPTDASARRTRAAVADDVQNGM